MKRTFKFRLYPNKRQEEKLNKTLETCRGLYNELLGVKKETYEATKENISGYDLNNLIKQYYKIERKQLKEVHSQVLQNIPDRINKAFSNYFRRVKEKKKRIKEGKKNAKKMKVGFPRFKKFYKSISYPQSGFDLNGKLKLSKIGEVKIKQHRELKGEIKTLTIKKVPSGKWFASFSCEIESTPKQHLNKDNSVGIDVGLKKFATLSDGTVIENPKFLKKSERKIKREHKRLSKKQKGSVNRNKQRIKLARRYETLTNQRVDFLHKITYRLTQQYGYIALENLNINGMVHHPFLAKHILDASWGKFANMLIYKEEESGGLAEQFAPAGTTINCSQCGCKVPKTLATRIHRCPNCGLIIDRDLNASINILNKSVRQELSEFKPVERGVRFLNEVSLSEKQEAPQLVGG